jgi:type I restriction-modification system DNA methylase subunit
MFCIDKALSFLYDVDNLKLAASWIEQGKITVNGVELKTNLTPEHKYAIVKSYTASKGFTAEQKSALKTKAFEGDTSDKAHQVQKTCEYSIPEAALKA